MPNTSSPISAVCRTILFLEGILNFSSGFLLTFFPGFCLETQGLPADDALARGNLAQFGSLVMLLGLIGLRCHATVELVDALLFGDILWMYVFYFMMEEVVPDIPWTMGSHFSFWIVVFLALVRTIFLVDQRVFQQQKKRVYKAL
uniref:Uncharacterized protein n=1 Tax=Paramoeba aestuarina TaxID=180227 RepID=A0A7S4JLV2_9EUKA|mmetsp:Transcript_11638/g.17636  ORF Transcript_11638/g.17636 Transcript_11638/m.17636 type:complete len:145 (+) Transcript_11638:160-594(+)